jgi:hypothetical protein
MVNGDEASTGNKQGREQAETEAARRALPGLQAPSARLSDRACRPSTGAKTMHRNPTPNTSNSSQAAYLLISIRRLCNLGRRDVSAATSRIAKMLGPEFAIPASGLADIESGRVMPTVFGLSSLCAVYNLEMPQVLYWYGIQPGLKTAA